MNDLSKLKTERTTLINSVTKYINKLDTENLKTCVENMLLSQIKNELKRK